MGAVAYGAVSLRLYLGVLQNAYPNEGDNGLPKADAHGIESHHG